MIRTLKLITALTFFGFVPTWAQPVDTPVVQTINGPVSGRASPGGEAVFRSIPFAAPPIGSLRWRAPAPPPSWTSVRDVSKSAPSCLQSQFGSDPGRSANSNEDCLYLSVRTPSLSGHLPVLVWIHGGGNRAGGANDFGNATIVQHGVVLVALQYRLDLFGFLSLPALSAETTPHASGNYGIMDQIAALQWIKANIAKFGGDPQNITIAGQSAGAHDVGMLMVAKSARGLFQKAIEESGSVGFGVPPKTLAAHEQLGEMLMASLNLPNGSEGLKQLRMLDGRELLAASLKLIPPGVSDPNFIWQQAVVDGQVLTETPIETLRAGREAKVPLIIGNNAKEFGLKGGNVALPAAISYDFGATAAQAEPFYQTTDRDPMRGDAQMRFITDLRFRCPADIVAELHRRNGAPVWQYEFAVHAPGKNSDVRHGSEVPFVLDLIPQAPLQTYWINFARGGDPNGPGLPTWPRQDDAGTYLDFTPTGAIVDKGLRAAVCHLMPRV